MKTKQIFRTIYHSFLNPRILYYDYIRRLLKSRELIIIGSAHKVGSTWVYSLLRDLCALRTLSLPASVLRSHPTEQAVDIDIVEIIKNIKILNGGFIFKSHSYPPPTEFVFDPDACVKFLTVIRDPRDVIVSASFYLGRLPQGQGGWGKEFASLSDTEKIVLVIKRGDFINSRLREWFSCPFAYKIKYEDLLTNGVGEIEKILGFLNLKYSENTIKHFYERHSFKQKAGRKLGVEDKKAFFRKGISGDWKNYFTKDLINTFKISQNGEWNKLLILLGYEKHLNW